MVFPIVEISLVSGKNAAPAKTSVHGLTGLGDGCMIQKIFNAVNRFPGFACLSSGEESGVGWRKDAEYGRMTLLAFFIGER
jgi:hypothetical protein